MKSYLLNNIDLDSDEVVSVLDELPFWSAPFGIKLLENLKLKKGITALDIGFGNGFPITEIAMRLGNSSKIYGIDPWLAANKRVVKKIKLYGITNIELLNGVAENLPFPDHSLDLITSNNGINNVSDLDRVLSECARVIKTGGQFLISMNLNTSLIEFYNVMEEALKMAGIFKEIEDMQKHIYEKRKPLNEMILKLQDNGFELKKLAKDKFDYTFADGTAMFHHYFIRLAFMESWKSFVPVERQEMIFDQIEQRLNNQASKLGFLKMSIPFVVMDCERKYN